MNVIEVESTGVCYVKTEDMKKVGGYCWGLKANNETH